MDEIQESGATQNADNFPIVFIVQDNKRSNLYYIFRFNLFRLKIIKRTSIYLSLNKIENVSSF